jgi:2-oxoglutarate dehydrogenase E1 component
VIFTPKSLLRLPVAQSKVEELASGTFQRVIDDTLASQQPNQVRRLLVCSGKVYYDLLKKREELLGDAAPSVAIVRVEELYPWPAEQITQIVRRYPRTERLYWVQEEPANMGAWTFVRSRLQDDLLPGERFAYAGRPESASPATGSARVHRRQQAELLAAAFEGLD